MGYRGYKYTYQVPLTPQVGFLGLRVEELKNLGFLGLREVLGDQGLRPALEDLGSMGMASVPSKGLF